MSKSRIFASIIFFTVVAFAGPGCRDKDDPLLWPRPVAEFTATPITGTAPLQVTFTDASTGVIGAWEWDFDNNSVIDSTNTNATHTYNNPGVYTVSLTVTGPGGFDKMTKINLITIAAPAAPVADFTATPTSGEEPLEVAFTDISTGTVDSWAWDFDNDASIDSTAQNPTHIYATAGTYTVSLTVTNTGGNDTATKINYITVTAIPAPVAQFSGTPTSGTLPLEVAFSDLSTGNITSWAWDFDNDTTIDSTAQNPTHTYDTDGLYTVSLTVTGPGGSDIMTKTDYIAAGTIATTPSAGFTADTIAGNAPLLVTFTDSSTGTITDWLWSFGDGTTSIAQHPSHSYDTEGVYTVELTVTGPGGSDTMTATDYITAYGLVADFSADQTAGTSPLTVQFTDLSTGNIVSWEWDFDNDASIDSTAQNPSHIYDTVGLYTVSLLITDDTGATDLLTRTDYIDVSWPAPVADFTADMTSGPSPLLVTFTDASVGNITTWEWDFDNDTVIDSTEQNPTHLYDMPGVYDVSLTVTGPGGTNTMTKLAYITSQPLAADFMADLTQVVAPQEVQFTDLSPGTIISWEWDFDNDSVIDSTEQNPTHIYDTPGWYTVTLVISSAVSWGTAIKQDYILVSTSPIWYVDSTTIYSTGNGTTWLEAFPTIQDGLDQASDYDIIMVADGTYAGLGNKDLDFAGKPVYLMVYDLYATGIWTIDCEGVGRGFLFDDGESRYSIVEGFTIINGSVLDENGGGILCENSSSPTITGCTISACEAVVSAGSAYGGGIACDNSSPAITGCTITGSTATLGGGGIYCTNAANPTILNNRITLNQTGGAGWGGGIYLDGCSPAIINCNISDNSALAGGGITLNTCSPVITNCTFAYNVATGTGGAISSVASSATINNTILWGSAAPSGSEIAYDAASVITLNYCDLPAGSTAGTGTISLNNCLAVYPEFVNLAQKNYTLKGNSLCRDAGSDALVPAGITTDLLGVARIIVTVDMGAYEK